MADRTARESRNRSTRASLFAARNSQWVATAWLLLAMPGIAIAQDAVAARSLPTDLLRSAPAGSTVTVVESDGTGTAGTVVSLTPAAITLLVRDRPVTIAASRVDRITRVDSTRNGAVIGLIAGAAGGLTFGLLLNAICVNETGSCPGAVFMLTGLGAGIGAGIGAASDGLRHGTIYAARVGARPEFTSSITAGLGGGRTTVTSGYEALATPPTMIGSWTYLSSDGVGVEVETSRTRGQEMRGVPCVRVPSNQPFVAATLVGTCAGAGEEGIGTTTMLTGKFIYAFGHRRLQPYVGLGLAARNMEIWSPQVRSSFGNPNSAFVVQSMSRHVGVNTVIDAGAWFTLAGGLSIRPAAGVILGGQSTTARGSVGLSYRW